MPRHESAFVGNCEQNKCYSELSNAYQTALTYRMDHNHTDEHQVSLCLYFETQITLIFALFHSDFER